ncbi:MAG: hypothetical protein V2A71_04475 [Candidatus Eisenbacteria bacterium]
MNTKELVKRGSDEVVALYCGKCGLVYRTTEMQLADRCCVEEPCKCGKPKMKGWSVCETCLKAKDIAEEQARFEKAKHIPFDEYEGEWCYSDAHKGSDGYFPIDDLDEILADMAPENRPKYVWACEPFGLDRIDAVDLVSSLLEEHHEDAMDDVDVEGLQKLLDKWVDEQSVTSYAPDYSQAVLVEGVLEAVAEHEKEASEF